MAYLLTILLCIAADQAVKLYVVSRLAQIGRASCRERVFYSV